MHGKKMLLAIAHCKDRKAAGVPATNLWIWRKYQYRKSATDELPAGSFAPVVHAQVAIRLTSALTAGIWGEVATITT